MGNVVHNNDFARMPELNQFRTWRGKLDQLSPWHRRWSRLSKIQTDVHNKLLDRFTSNEDLLAYIQTPVGRKFLESAPIPPAVSGTL